MTRIQKNKFIKLFKQTVIVTIFSMILVACGGGGTDPQSTSSFTLLNTVDISQILSPSGVGRPDVIAIGDTLYLADSTSKCITA